MPDRCFAHCCCYVSEINMILMKNEKISKIWASEFEIGTSSRYSCSISSREFSSITLLSFSIAGPKLWNNLPASLRNADSLNSF